jgi:hypothetical protein
MEERWRRAGRSCCLAAFHAEKIRCILAPDFRGPEEASFTMEESAISAANGAERLRARALLRRAGSPGWLLASSALLLIAWSFAVPVFEAPDEPVHWQYAQYVHEQKKLPRYDARFVEANQPPLCYL